MSRILPPMNWFRVFEAAARHLKFTAAADELGMTQSAVSQQIRSLELRLGTPLFMRQPRGLMLTDAGRKLLPKVSISMQHLQQATEMFDVGAQDDVLTVATSVSVAQWIIGPNLPSFMALFPKVRVRLLSTIWADDFKASLADVEIRFGAAAQVGRAAKRLEPDQLIAVAAPSFQEPLAAAPLIEAVGISEGWRQWGQLAGITPTLAPRLFVDSYGMALTLAQNGAGVALASSLLARPLIASGELKQIGDVALASTEGYFLAVKPDNNIALAFSDWLARLIG